MIQIAKIQFNPFGENTYILHNGTDAIIVDCGAYNAKEMQTLEAFIAKNNLNPIMVAATHGHIDHICGAQNACRHWNIPFAMSSLDSEILVSNLDYAASMGFDLEAVPEITIDLFKLPQITLGEDIISIIPTPGHTPGGVCFYIKNQNALLSGDTLFAQSIGRTDLPGGDYKQLMSSIIKNLIPLDGSTKIFPGHGADTTLAHEAMYNPFITEVMQGEVKY